MPAPRDRPFHLLDARNPAYPAQDTLQMVMSYYDNGRDERCFTRDGATPAGRTD